MRFGQTLSTEPYHAGWGDVAKTQQVSLLLGNTAMSNALVVTIARASSTAWSQKTAEQHERATLISSPLKTPHPAQTS
jgi:hypothetical protein